MINRKFETVNKYCYAKLDQDYQDYIASNDVEYNDRVFVYYGVSKSTFRPIVTINGMEYVLFRTRSGIDYITYTGLNAYFNQVKLPNVDQSYLVSELGGEFYYSTGNSKIQLAGKKMDLNRPISFGLPSVISCWNAGLCAEYCYAETVNAVYLSTLKLALHNYYLVMTSNQAELVRLFDNMIKSSKTELVRIDDTGDIVNMTEFVAIAESARMNPDVILYAYTKSTQIVWNYLESGNSLPDNFRVNVSSTDNVESTEYATKLVRKYGLTTCYILETADDIQSWFEAGLPFNAGEIRAIMSDMDFAIGLHGTFKKGTTEFEANKMSLRIHNEFGVETC